MKEIYKDGISKKELRKFGLKWTADWSHCWSSYWTSDSVMSIGTVITALGLLKDLAPSIGKVAQRFLDGKASSEELQAEAAKHELTAEVQLALAQVQLNSNEAKHASIFVAGWRPMVGWICALAMGFQFPNSSYSNGNRSRLHSTRCISYDACIIRHVRYRWIEKF